MDKTLGNIPLLILITKVSEPESGRADAAAVEQHVHKEKFQC